MNVGKMLVELGFETKSRVEGLASPAVHAGPPKGEIFDREVDGCHEVPKKTMSKVSF